jgi:DNA primase large subunit
MDYKPSQKELSHFPFLKKSQNHIKSRFSTLDSLLKDLKGEELINRAILRIRDSMSQKKIFHPEVSESVDDEIAAYALARIIVSCINDKQLIERLTRYEAERVYYFIVNEEEWNQNYKMEDTGYSRLCIALADEMGIQITRNRMPLIDYVELVSPLHEDRFRLVNRHVDKGFVEIKKEERYELLRERIRVAMRQDLPHKVPASFCEQLSPKIAAIKKAYQEQMLQQFGSVEESAFPPCMQALVHALTAGTNLTHAGRFALTTFFHTIGMSVSGIAQMYARSPDFDPEKTMYQVEHITGRGGSGTEYIAPACAAMKTTGLCVHRDQLCESVNHPLNYYRQKKKFTARVKKEIPPTADNPLDSTR